MVLAVGCCGECDARTMANGAFRSPHCSQLRIARQCGEADSWTMESLRMVDGGRWTSLQARSRASSNDTDKSRNCFFSCFFLLALLLLLATTLRIYCCVGCRCHRLTNGIVVILIFPRTSCTNKRTFTLVFALRTHIYVQNQCSANDVVPIFCELRTWWLLAITPNR